MFMNLFFQNATLSIRGFVYKNFLYIYIYKKKLFLNGFVIVSYLK